MSGADWSLARAEPPLYRHVVLRELRAALAAPPLGVWLPSVVLTALALALNDLVPCDVPVAAVFFGVWIARAARHRHRQLARPSDADLALREHGVGWPVDLLVLQGAAPTGTDRGMLWVEDGRLLFVGGRTSFSLDPRQARGPCRWTAPVLGLRHGLLLPLEGRLALSLAAEERAEVAAMIDAWAARPSDVRGQGPPQAVGPGALPRTGLFACALATTLAWSGIAYLIFRYHDTPDALVGAAFAAYAAWELGLRSPLLRWRALFDFPRSPLSSPGRGTAIERAPGEGG